jgi:hypothetical protein
MNKREFILLNVMYSITSLFTSHSLILPVLIIHFDVEKYIMYKVRLSTKGAPGHGT